MIDFYRLKIHVTRVATALIDVTKVGAKNRGNGPNSNRSIKLTNRLGSRTLVDLKKVIILVLVEGSC